MNMNFLNIQGQNLAQNQAQSQIQSKIQAANRNTPPKAPTEFEKKAREAADSFEAVFLSQILKSMSIGLKTDGNFGGGHSEEIFRDVLNEEMANNIARNGGIGLSDAVYREILKTQEVDNPQDIKMGNKDAK